MRRLLLALVLFGGCSHTGGARGGAAGTRGIMLECDVAHAAVFVDDYYLDYAGRWRDKPMPLAAGPHRVELTAEGYYPYYGEVEVPPSGFARLLVRMRKTVD